MRRLAIVLTAVAALAGVAPAAAIGESFETPAYAPGTIIYGPDQSPNYGSNPGGPSAAVPGFTFSGFSGVIGNGTAVFVPTTDGTQQAFLQGYQGSGSQIDWAITGLTPGHGYSLTFAAAGSLVVPTEGFGVSVFGAPTTSFAPGSSYTPYSINFVATASSGTISFIGDVQSGNAATALDSLAIGNVPEPAAWALMIGGFAMTGFAARRRRVALSA